jgi:hypothetical protein
LTLLKPAAPPQRLNFARCFLPSAGLFFVRRLIAIVLMLLLPLQSAWALVAMPCKGHVNLPQVALAAASVVEAHEAHAGHDAAMAGHAHHASHDGAAPAPAPAPAPAHEHHAHHSAAPVSGHDGGSGDAQSSPGPDSCSGSAACMSLHSPLLAGGFEASLPALPLPGWQPPAEGSRFSSVPPQRLHRPPIRLAA